MNGTPRADHSSYTAWMSVLAGQLKAVIRPGELAMLDSGPTLSTTALVGIMTAAGFVEVRRCRSWPLDRKRDLHRVLALSVTSTVRTW